MKRSAFKQKKRHLIRARNEYKRTTRKRFDWDRGLARNAVRLTSTNGVRTVVPLLGVDVTLPSKLCLTENQDESAKTLSLIRNSLSSIHGVRFKVRNPRNFISSYCDFSPLKEISTPAAIILLAEFHRNYLIKKQSPGVVNVNLWDERVIAKLNRLGFFTAFGLPNQKHSGSSETDKIRVLKFISGKNNIELEEIGDQISEIISFSANGCENEGLISTTLTSAVSEAITNVRHHAYPDDHDYAFRHTGRYWFAAAGDQDARKISITMYDQGVTIPLTYNKLSLPKRILDFMKQGTSDEPHDASCIEAAVTFGNSQTDNDHRGRGLPQIKEAVKCCKSGRLMIYSRAGYYEYCNNDGEFSSKAYVIPHSVGGTLINWELEIGR